MTTRHSRIAPSLALALALAILPLAARAEDEKKAEAPAASYPLDVCPVSGKKLGAMGDPVILQQDGREVRLCCKNCQKAFEGDPGKFTKKMDELIIAQQLASYPTDKCLVSDDKLGGDMGEPINYVLNNRLIRICCKSCIKDLKKDPAKFMGMLDKAVIEKELKDYPLENCVVSGEKLGGKMGEPVNFVHANHLVRFCCKGCVKEFSKDPAKYTAKIDEARKAKGAK